MIGVYVSTCVFNEHLPELKKIFLFIQLQQAEAEELRQREANLTALAAIGPRKKRKLDFSDSTNSVVSFFCLPFFF